MRTLGFIATAIGLVMLLISCNMDVSVATELGSRVNNIGLMQQQSMLVNVSLGLMLIGVIMWIAGRKKLESPAEVPDEIRSYSAEEMKDLDVLLADKGWTGISLSASDPKVVHSVAAGSSAAHAGILPGDRIIQVDGQFSSNDLRANVIQLAGEPGSVAVLKLRRGDAAVTAEVVREASGG